VSPVLAAPLFLVSLAITLFAAASFARRLDRLGVRFGFPEALIGLLTALAADGPEISSALFALAKGAHNVSVGVLVGSNAFNLAAMIGISGLLAGSVCLPRATLLLEGLAGALVTVIAAAVLMRWLGAVPAAALAVLVFVPYLLLVVRGAQLLGRYDRERGVVGEEARGLEQRTGFGRAATRHGPAHHLLGLIVLDVVLIAGASAGMVEAALSLGDHWHVSRPVLGVLVLAPLTSIPNALTGVRLGLCGRSAALVGERFNSNSINLGADVIVPALLITLAAPSATGRLDLAWLIGMTAVTLGLLAGRRGMRRPGAVGLIVLYAGFVGVQLVSR
jgi:cation:H+ antiporter